jgi:hypothetical protein
VSQKLKVKHLTLPNIKVSATVYAKYNITSSHYKSRWNLLKQHFLFPLSQLSEHHAYSSVYGKHKDSHNVTSWGGIYWNNIYLFPPPQFSKRCGYSSVSAMYEGTPLCYQDETEHLETTLYIPFPQPSTRHAYFFLDVKYKGTSTRYKSRRNIFKQHFSTSPSLKTSCILFFSKEIFLRLPIFHVNLSYQPTHYIQHFLCLHH